MARFEAILRDAIESLLLAARRGRDVVDSVEASGEEFEQIALVQIERAVDTRNIASSREQRCAQHLAGDTQIDRVEEFVDGVGGNCLANRGHCLAEVTIERERVVFPTGVFANATDFVEFFFADVVIDDHHEQEQFDGCLVFAVLRGMHRHVGVEVFQSRSHLANVASGSGLNP